MTEPIQSIRVKYAAQIAIDLSLLTLAYLLAYWVRFEDRISDYFKMRMLVTLPVIVGLEYLSLRLFRVHLFSWRYTSLREAAWLAVALSCVTAPLLALRIMLPLFAPQGIPNLLAANPVGILTANFVLSLSFLAGARGFARLYFEHRSRRQRGRGLEGDREVTNTLLVGAGDAGVMIAKEILSHPALGMVAVGFLDDDPHKLGKLIQGLPVLGTTAQIGELKQATDAKQVLITIPTLRRQDLKRISDLCHKHGLRVRTIPPVHELVGENVSFSLLRDVSIEDVLGREAVKLDEAGIHQTLEGKQVLVSGAGGSIGSELCRQICRFRPARLILLERSEPNLFLIHRELLAKCPSIPLVPCIGDIGDQPRMEAIFSRWKPHVVYHAAAHKHVPMMEWNPSEAIKNNVFGTKTLAETAHAHQVERFLLISTDKAVNPTSVMGACKRMGEQFLQVLASTSKTRFVAVRFGNVLGSSGSVVPIFREQIAKGGPVTVTDPEMRRYFMTIPEACQLVLQAVTMGKGGEIFILDMGEPVKIVDLARQMIELSGLQPDVDIQIQFSGVRPGEKLFEELSFDAETMTRTHHEKVFLSKMPPPAAEPYLRALAALHADLPKLEEKDLRQRMKEIVPEYQLKEGGPA